VITFIDHSSSLAYTRDSSGAQSSHLSEEPGVNECCVLRLPSWHLWSTASSSGRCGTRKNQCILPEGNGVSAPPAVECWSAFTRSESSSCLNHRMRPRMFGGVEGRGVTPLLPGSEINGCLNSSRSSTTDSDLYAFCPALSQDPFYPTMVVWWAPEAALRCFSVSLEMVDCHR